MISEAAAQEAAAAEDVVWPAGDRAVLANRAVRAGTRACELGCFDDDVWRLTPAHPDPHRSAVNLLWGTYPSQLVRPFKTFVLAALDCPHPVEMSGKRTHEQAGCGTVSMWFLRLRPFAVWLDGQDVESLSEVGDGLLEAYLGQVQALPVTPNAKYQLLNAVRALWAYGGHLPEACRLATVEPWQGRPLRELADMPGRSRFNATPRIAAATMEALLDWSLRIVEDLGPDIRDAWRQLRILSAGEHPSQRVYDGLPPSQRVRLFVQEAAHTGSALPGDPRTAGAVSSYHLGRLLGLKRQRRQTCLGVLAAAYAAELGVPIADDCYLGTITGRVGDRAWRERPVTAAELALLIRVLVAACFVVICYLTGARPGEVLPMTPARTRCSAAPRAITWPTPTATSPICKAASPSGKPRRTTPVAQAPPRPGGGSGHQGANRHRAAQREPAHRQGRRRCGMTRRRRDRQAEGQAIRAAAARLSSSPRPRPSPQPRKPCTSSRSTTLP
ncbi:hypothetical protein ACH4PU_22325 [Streptomyces sp. NPDC021100]|uniref:hypothetical protein n=1 Tax=Streptomyces sp. NPDC021100 TaxID=3365114 RepID=UPI0037BDB8AF